MAASVGRFCKPGLFQARKGINLNQVNSISTKSWSNGKKNLMVTIGALAGGAGALIYALDCSVKASELVAIPPKLHWPHSGLFDSLDHASIRRGYEVYKQVCSACHSMMNMKYRRLIDVCHSEEEAKKEAADIMVKDGPNSEGEFFMRPGKIADGFPDPYPNEEAARHANNGAHPPDLTLITRARKGNENYIFHLLTSYYDPPAGHPVGEGQYYNPYFPGGNISMAKALYDDVIEYEDGTPATTSQLAKDVCTFLKWASEPEFDIKKLYLIKLLFWWPIIFGAAYYYKRLIWSTLKTTKVVFHPPSKRLK